MQIYHKDVDIQQDNPDCIVNMQQLQKKLECKGDKKTVKEKMLKIYIKRILMTERQASNKS